MKLKRWIVFGWLVVTAVLVQQGVLFSQQPAAKTAKDDPKAKATDPKVDPKALEVMKKAKEEQAAKEASEALPQTN